MTNDSVEKHYLNEQRDSLLRTLERWGISDRTLRAMRKVQREDFVPPELKKSAYVDEPLPIDDGQTISAPHMVAIMCELLQLVPGDKVLEVGTGSGYHSAVMAHLIDDGTIYSIERSERLAKEAKKRLPSTVIVIVGDGSLGIPDQAPFDKILVTCSAPDIPSPLLEQLKPRGRMVIPIGRWIQELYLVIKTDGIQKTAQGGVAFVPLIGKYGFDA